MGLHRLTLAARRLGGLVLLMTGLVVAYPGAAQTGTAELALPASFRGVLPCPDCAGVRTQLDLWPDGVFHLQRVFVGKAGNDDERGRWRRDPSRPVLLLYGGRPMPLAFEILGPRTLRPLDLNGKALVDSTAHDLASDGTLASAELTLGLHGMFRYMADAARLEECLTGRSYPVAMEGDFLALQRAYMAAPKSAPGAPLMASFDGGIALRPPMEGPGPVPTVVVRRFIGLWPGQTCERAMAHASLSNQYWRVVSLRGQPVKAADGRREPHVILRGGDYAADVGCSRFTGVYRVEGRGIRFDAPAAAPACPQALEARQRTLVDVLAAARSWSIQAQALELFDSGGAPIALLEAVYLR